jgi:2',3'-cyclic-nucleotide 2'-phosphodiesterase (5'-nucleotidase family)
MGVIPFTHCLCVLLAAATSTVAFGSRHHQIADSVTNNAAFRIPSRFSKDKFTHDTDRMAYNYPPNKVIGNASGEIDGSILCTLTECPMGNLVCDALLDSKSSQGAQVCITNADSINGSLRFGSITAKDLDKVLPFPDLAIVLKIPGSTLLKALEKGLEAIGNKSRGGRFPQIAGMNLTVNSRGTVGSRVQSLAIGGKAVVPSKQYILVTNDFLASGGYGLTWKGSKNLTRKPLLINEIVSGYLLKHNPYKIAPRGRISNSVIGKASASIEGSLKCRSGECQMGDLFCDALLEYGASDVKPQVCITNGGSVNSSINAGDITEEGVYKGFPFPDYTVTLTMPGSTIRAALEHGLNFTSTSGGGFPQIGGMEVVFRPNATAGTRLTSVKIGGAPLMPSKRYTVVTIDYLANGGNGYSWPSSTAVEPHGRDIHAVVMEYLARNSPYRPVSIPAAGGRIAKRT